jgi:hypothetical protein
MECAGSLDTGGNGDWYTENKRGSTERERNNLRPSETGEESALRLPLKTIYVQQHSIVVVVVVVVVGDIYQEALWTDIRNKNKKGE